MARVKIMQINFNDPINMRSRFSPVKSNNTANTAKTFNLRSDSLTISSNAGKTDERFMEALKRTILNDVKEGTHPAVINDIKKEISLGEYDINPADIVRKMMLDTV